MQDEVACDYFHLIDSDFLEWVKEVIDNLIREYALERDWVLDDRNAQLWTWEEDTRMDIEWRAEVETLRKLLGVAIVAIAMLLAIGMGGCWHKGIMAVHDPYFFYRDGLCICSYGLYVLTTLVT